MCFYNEGNLISHSASTDQQGSSEFLGENKIITEGKKNAIIICFQHQIMHTLLRPIASHIFVSLLH